MEMSNVNLFKGTAKICLWMKYKYDQKSGPPLKNAFVQFRAGINYESDTKIVLSGYTDESGCVSEPFEVTSATSEINIFADTPRGTFSSAGHPVIKPFPPSTQVDFGEIGERGSIEIGDLPEKYFPQLYSCSTCKDATDANLCTLGWDFQKCCGYDFGTDQCREVQSNPFSFGNVCEDCEAVETKHTEQKEPGFKESIPSPPIDCSNATHYYRDTSMSDTPRADKLSPLSDSGCTNPNNNVSVYKITNVYRYGTSCCAYDYATEKCGLWFYYHDRHPSRYQYMNDVKGMFDLQCSFGLSSQNVDPTLNIGAIVGGIIFAVIFALALLCCICFYRRKRTLSLKETQIQNNRPSETQKGDEVHKLEGNKATEDGNVEPIPLPSAPPKEESNVAIALRVIDRSEATQVVYDAEIVSYDV